MPKLEIANNNRYGHRRIEEVPRWDRWDTRMTDVKDQLRVIALYNISGVVSKSDLVSAPDFWNKSIALCWSFGLGRRTCQLSQRGFSACFGSKLCFVSFSISVLAFNYDFGVIHLPLGARVFVVQTAVCVTKTHLADVENGIISPYRVTAFTEYSNSA